METSADTSANADINADANANADSPDNCTTQVMFDGACPLCRREIALYQRLPASEPITWVDVSSGAFQAPDGMSRQQLLRRFHLLTADGRVLSGAAAFLFIWQRLPGWRWLARLAHVPGVPFVLECCYRGFLVLRPSLQTLLRFIDTRKSRHAGQRQE